MQQSIKTLKVGILILVTILVLWGCAGIVPQTTQPATNPIQGDLTVIQPSARVIRNGEPEPDIAPNGTVKVGVNDRIELDEQSRSLLSFPNVLKAELVRNADLLLSEINQESGGSTEVTLTLNQGHVFLGLNETSLAKVKIETPYGTIKTMDYGTELDICHTKELTCVWVKKGSAEVIGDGQRQTVSAGEASYIVKDRPPTIAFCAPLATFRAWEENFRNSADTSTLGDLIAESPQEPCSVETTEPTITLEATAEIQATSTIEQQPTATSTQAELSSTPISGQQGSEIPPDAHILYKDDFTSSAGGWPQVENDNGSVGYTETGYYYIQLSGPDFKYPVYVPNTTNYKDVNIDLRASTDTADEGDFDYGLILRRSGDRYYAFTISPRTNKWYVQKSMAADALTTLQEGTDDDIQGLQATDTLRVYAKGSNFLFLINDRLVYQLNDADYASGEVGLFVEAHDSPNARILFDSITIWSDQLLPLNPTPLSREKCFNKIDDDGDGLIDKADRDCKPSYP